MNAEYFRNQGYVVIERDYGTRVYSEMFTIEDEHGQPFIEVRRNPQSGSSEFTGLSDCQCICVWLIELATQIHPSVT